MENEDSREFRKAYIRDITAEVTKMIAKSSDLSIGDAKNKFINSITLVEW